MIIVDTGVVAVCANAAIAAIDKITATSETRCIN